MLLTSERGCSGLGTVGRFDGSRGGSVTGGFDEDESVGDSISRFTDIGSWVAVTGTRRGPRVRGRCFDSSSGSEG